MKCNHVCAKGCQAMEDREARAACRDECGCPVRPAVKKIKKKFAKKKKAAKKAVKKVRPDGRALEGEALGKTKCNHVCAKECQAMEDREARAACRDECGCPVKKAKKVLKKVAKKKPAVKKAIKKTIKKAKKVRPDGRELDGEALGKTKCNHVCAKDCQAMGDREARATCRDECGCPVKKAKKVLKKVAKKKPAVKKAIKKTIKKAKKVRPDGRELEGEALGKTKCNHVCAKGCQAMEDREARAACRDECGCPVKKAKKVLKKVAKKKPAVKKAIKKTIKKAKKVKTDGSPEP